MDALRWQRVEELFAGALALPPGDRGEFLNGACSDDLELRRELESLLDTRETFLRNSLMISKPH